MAQIINPYKKIGDYRSPESMAAFADAAWDESDESDGWESGDTDIDSEAWSDQS